MHPFPHDFHTSKAQNHQSRHDPGPIQRHLMTNNGNNNLDALENIGFSYSTVCTNFEYSNFDLRKHKNCRLSCFSQTLWGERSQKLHGQLTNDPLTSSGAESCGKMQRDIRTQCQAATDPNSPFQAATCLQELSMLLLIRRILYQYIYIYINPSWSIYIK